MTSTFGPDNTLSSFLPIEFQIDGEKDEIRELIAKRERLTANIVNIREIASYELLEQLNGQQWFSTSVAGQPRINRYSFRKTFDMIALNGGANLAAGGTLAFAHGITGLTIPTRIFGSATSVTPTFLPLPYASATANKNIEIWADAVNINIINGAGQPALKQIYITMEFLKQ